MQLQYLSITIEYHTIFLIIDFSNNLFNTLFCPEFMKHLCVRVKVESLITEIHQRVTFSPIDKQNGEQPVAPGQVNND